MNTTTTKQSKDLPISHSLLADCPIDESQHTPIVIGFYYAIYNDITNDFTIVQIVKHSTQYSRRAQVKLRQFALTYKALPDFLIPEQLGDAVANFWLSIDDFKSWQPLMMQRGIVR